MSIENRKKEACSRGTSSLGTATVNRPSKHSDGRLVVYERVVAFGLLLFVFGCEGTWLDCFLRAGDDECVPRVHKTTTSVDITTATEPSSHRRGTASPRIDE